MGGAYVKSKRLQPGEKQNAALIIRDCDTEIKIGFTVQSERKYVGLRLKVSRQMAKLAVFEPISPIVKKTRAAKQRFVAPS